MRTRPLSFSTPPHFSPCVSTPPNPGESTMPVRSAPTTRPTALTKETSIHKFISRSTLQPRSEKLPINASLPGIARIQEKSRTTPPRHWPNNPVLSLDSRSPCWRSLHRTSHLHLRYRRHLQRKRPLRFAKSVVLLGWTVDRLVLVMRCCAWLCSATRVNVDGNLHLGFPRLGRVNCC